jgi:aspartate aminotransferase
MIKLSGAKPVIVKTGPENNFKITPQQLKETITPQTKLFILNSPTNPTGMVYTKKELLALGEVLLSKNIFCLSDEIYEKIIYDGLEYVSIASLFPEMKKICLVVNGVSKAYAMTGWRIGYAAGPAEIIKVMSSLQSHSTSGATSISQKAALSALTGPQEEVEKMRKEFEGRRDYIVSQLNSLPGISCFMPKGAFYVFPSISGLIGRKFQGETIKNSFHLAEMLLEKVHLAVVPGVAFGEDNYLRFSYATSLENIVEGISRLKKFIEGLEK